MSYSQSYYKASRVDKCVTRLLFFFFISIFCSSSGVTCTLESRTYSNFDTSRSFITKQDFTLVAVTASCIRQRNTVADKNDLCILCSPQKVCLSFKTILLLIVTREKKMKTENNARTQLLRRTWFKLLALTTQFQ